MKKQIILATIIILLGLGGFFIWRGSREVVAPTKLRVVTTFAPMYIFTLNVVGNLADVQNLSQSHPSDAAAVAKSAIVVKHGRGIDDWVDQVINETRRPDIKVITASQGIEAHTGAPSLNLEGTPSLPSTRETVIEPEADNPYLWLDPYLAIREVEQIRDGFMAYDPAHADVYARNAEQFLLRLLMLDSEIREMLSVIKRRDFMGTGSEFSYFAYEYELRPVAIVHLPSPNPSEAELKIFAQEVQKNNTKVVFVGSEISQKIIEALERFGLRVAQIDSFKASQLSSDDYETVMGKNVEAMVKAFQE